MFKIKKFKLRKEKNDDLKLKKVEPEDLTIPVCSQCKMVKPLVDGICDDCKPLRNTGTVEPSELWKPEQNDDPRTEGFYRAEYEKLQDQYRENPSEEIRERMVEVQAKLLNVRRPTEEHDSRESVQQNEGSPEAVTPATIIDVVQKDGLQKEAEASVNLDHGKLQTISDPAELPPIQIPDEIPANADLSEVELKKLEKVKLESEQKLKDQTYLEEQKKLAFQQQCRELIEKQKAKAPEVREIRQDWREQIPLLEIEALKKFVIMFEDEEYTLNYQQQQEKEVKEEEAEVKESINEVIKEDQVTESKLNSGETKSTRPEPKQVGVKIEVPQEQSEIEEIQEVLNEKQENPEGTAHPLEPDKSMIEKLDDAKIENVIDLIMPDDLDDALKKIWAVLPRDTQLDLIEKHKVKVEKIIVEKKKKFFGNRINFSLKRKKLKTEVDTDKKISFFNRYILKKNELSDIEAYCNICKHGVLAHQHKGKSAGCKHCGCLVTVQKILEVNKIRMDLEEKEVVQVKDTGKICNCGHREVVHREKGFCEEKDCYCIVFTNATESKNI